MKIRGQQRRRPLEEDKRVFNDGFTAVRSKVDGVWRIFAQVPEAKLGIPPTGDADDQRSQKEYPRSRWVVLGVDKKLKEAHMAAREARYKLFPPRKGRKTYG